MSSHSDLTAGEIHIPFNWVWPTSTERNAQSVTVDDLQKMGVQEDDGSLWILTAVTPTWEQVGGQPLISSGTGAGSIILGSGTYVGTASGNYGVAGGYSPRAKGDFSIAMGGYEPYSYGAKGVAIGGKRSYAYGDYSTVVGGYESTAAGNYAVVIGGFNNYASENCVSIGGYKNRAYGTYSFASGNNAIAHLRGLFARSAGQPTLDINQFFTAHLYRQVLHNITNWFPLYIDGTTTNLSFSGNSQLWTFSILISGMDQGGTKRFGFKIEGVASNTSAGTTAVLSQTVTTLYDTDDVSFDARVSIDDPNDALLVEVSDSDGAGDTINWGAFVSIMEVGFA